jgi:hypothetical protein
MATSLEQMKPRRFRKYSLQCFPPVCTEWCAVSEPELCKYFLFLYGSSLHISALLPLREVLQLAIPATFPGPTPQRRALTTFPEYWSRRPTVTLTAGASSSSNGRHVTARHNSDLRVRVLPPQIVLPAWELPASCRAGAVVAGDTGFEFRLGHRMS